MQGGVRTWAVSCSRADAGWDFCRLKNTQCPRAPGASSQSWQLSGTLSWGYYSERLHVTLKQGRPKAVGFLTRWLSSPRMNISRAVGESYQSMAFLPASCPPHFIGQSSQKPAQLQGKGAGPHLSMKAVSRNLRVIFFKWPQVDNYPYFYK